MSTASQRTHVVIPRKVVNAIDAAVGPRGRSRFLVDAAERELRRLAQSRALERAAGAWKAGDHPELRDGAAAWVRSLRSEGGRHGDGGADGGRGVRSAPVDERRGVAPARSRR